MDLEKEIRKSLGYEGNSKTVFAPYDGKEIATVPVADESTIDKKINQLHSSEERSLTERVEAIKDYSAAILEDLDKYAEIAAQESGIPYSFMKFRLGAALGKEPTKYAKSVFSDNWEDVLDGNWLQTPSENGSAMEQHLPYGVWLNMCPNNDSLGVGYQTRMELLLAGNKVIDKPGSRVPVAHILSLGKVKEIMPEYVDVVAAPGKRISYYSMKNESLAGIMLTGESRHGRAVASEAAKNNIQFRGEFEGSNVQLALADFNPEVAGKLSVEGSCAFNGIACANAHVASIERSYKDFRDAAIETGHFYNSHIGDPTNERTLIGPLVDSSLAKKDELIIEAAEKYGFEVLAGGEVNDNMVEFTLIEGLPHKLSKSISGRDLGLTPEQTQGLKYSLNNWSIVGPILFISEDFSGTLEHVVNIGQGREGYGLRNTIMSKDKRRMKTIVERLGSSMNVNNIHDYDPTQPWAGSGKSSTLNGHPLIETAMKIKRIKEVDHPNTTIIDNLS